MSCRSASERNPWSWTDGRSPPCRRIASCVRAFIRQDQLLSIERDFGGQQTMNNTFFRIALCFLVALAGACGSGKPAPPAKAIPVPNLGLIPMPRDVLGATGNFQLAANTDVVYSGGE